MWIDDDQAELSNTVLVMVADNRGAEVDLVMQFESKIGVAWIEDKLETMQRVDALIKDSIGTQAVGILLIARVADEEPLGTAKRGVAAAGLPLELSALAPAGNRAEGRRAGQHCRSASRDGSLGGSPEILIVLALVCIERVGMPQRESDVIEAIQQAVLAKGVDLEVSVKAVRIGDGLLF